jgi:hypothetical protein
MIMAIPKKLSIFGLLAIFAILMPVASGWAGFEGGPTAEPSDWSKVVGPELWGVVVMQCGVTEIGTIRVKRINDCNVETDTLVDTATVAALGCINNQSTYLYVRFPKATFFNGAPGVPTQPGQWIVTKVKNFSYKDPGGSGNAIISFDVQVKFELN